MTKTIGVILSGCGFMDGAEIHESVCTLLALDQLDAETLCFAPNSEFEVIDHRTGEPTGERRNALEESSRISRGPIQDLAAASAADLDAVILPGGFGAAKVLSDFATEGANCTVNPDVARLLREMHAAGKPIGAICIAPALLARALGDTNPTLTIGNDEATAQALEQMGCTHEDCPTDAFVIDRDNRIVTTPAYMLGPNIAAVYNGIRKAVNAVLELA